VSEAQAEATAVGLEAAMAGRTATEAADEPDKRFLSQSNNRYTLDRQ
jgi:hypothetical protein